MAKISQSTKGKQPKWKIQWPGSSDLATWFRCMLTKCDAIADDDSAMARAHLPIGHLAELGHVSEALKYVDRFLRRAPNDRALPTVRIARLGAEISLAADDLPRMEKYLARMAATEPLNTRKCAAGFSINAVREFRADNGLLDPAEAIDDHQRLNAQFRRDDRQVAQALAARKRKAASLAVAEMEQVASGHDDPWWRQQWTRVVIERYANMGDSAAVKRCVRKLDAEDRQVILDARTLSKLGMKREAIARAKRDIHGELEILRTTTDPNIHFPAMAIGRSLQFLADQGEAITAKRLLCQALREMHTWPVIELGWTTSAVYTAFAEAAASLGDQETADALLNDALLDGRSEKRSSWRQGAVGAALTAQASNGRIDAAIQEAQKIRSPRERRKALGKLFAKEGRWKELREVLTGVASPEEAADVCWWIKFELPGGEVKQR